MKFEAACNNTESCAFHPPQGMEDAGPYLHLLRAWEPCPTCGSMDITPYREVPDDVVLAAGKVVMTSGVANLVEADIEAVQYTMGLLRRHVRGDWGEVDPSDKKVNDVALKYVDGLPNGRVVSVYTVKDQQVFIITEQGRQSTTILLAEEY